MGIQLSEMLLEEVASNFEKKKVIAEKFFENQNFSNFDLALLLNNQIGDEKEITIIKKIWDKFLIKELVSVQPLSDTQGIYYYFSPEPQLNKNVIGSRKIKWNFRCNLNHSDLIAEEISTKLNRMIISSILNNARIHDTMYTYGINEYNKILSKMEQLSNTILEETGYGKGNWFITSPEIIAIFEAAGTLDNKFCAGVDYAGSLGDFKVYKDPLYPPRRITMGYKGNHRS